MKQCHVYEPTILIPTSKYRNSVRVNAGEPSLPEQHEKFRQFVPEARGPVHQPNIAPEGWDEFIPLTSSLWPPPPIQGGCKLQPANGKSLSIFLRWRKKMFRAIHCNSYIVARKGTQETAGTRAGKNHRSLWSQSCPHGSQQIVDTQLHLLLHHDWNWVHHLVSLSTLKT